MTNKQIDNRVKKLQAIEAKQKELEDQAEAIRAEIKADLESKVHLYKVNQLCSFLGCNQLVNQLCPFPDLQSFCNQAPRKEGMI